MMRACFSRLNICNYTRSTQSKLPLQLSSRAPLLQVMATDPASGARQAASHSSSTPALVQLFKAVRQQLQPGAPPTQAQAQQLCNLAAQVPLTEAGFPEAVLQDPSQVIPVLQEHYTRHPFFSGSVTYLHIYDDPTFSMGIFMLPAGTSIPLHDHPGMTVISQLLFGSLHVKAYDLLPGSPDSSSPPGSPTTTSSTLNQRASSSSGVKEGGSGGGGGGLEKLAASVKSKISWPGGSLRHSSQHPATLVMDKRVTAPQTLVLHPTNCNIHEFTAVTHCAILDILTPPYDEHNGRDCTYYEEVVPGQVHKPAAGALPLGTVLHLKEVKSDFCTSNAPYTGIRVV